MRIVRMFEQIRKACDASTRSRRRNSVIPNGVRNTLCSETYVRYARLLLPTRASPLLLVVMVVIVVIVVAVVDIGQAAKPVGRSAKQFSK